MATVTAAETTSEGHAGSAPAEALASDVDAIDDLYKGHKVVAMPTRALVGMSVKEVAHRTGRRSRSVGRHGIRSRNIVQDVYDRIGVSYGRGRASLDLSDAARPDSQQQNRNGQLKTDFGTPTDDARGDRSSEAKTDGGSGRRSRSLSRGRISRRWPPKRNQSEYLFEDSSESNPSDPVSVPSVQSESKGFSRSPSPWRPPSPASAKDERKNCRDPLPHLQPNQRAFSFDIKEEKKEEETCSRKSDDVGSLSLKQRISAYTGVVNKYSTLPRTFRQTTTPIKRESKSESSSGNSVSDTSVRSQNGDPSSSSSAAFTVPQPSAITSKNVCGAKTSTGHIADAFLAAIQSPSRSHSPGRLGRTCSPGADSLSVDDALFKPVQADRLDLSPEKHEDLLRRRKSLGHVRADRFPNQSQASGRKTAPVPAHYTPNQLILSELVDKLVEERVEARISALETRFDRRLRQIEDQIESKLNVRLDLGNFRNGNG